MPRSITPHIIDIEASGFGYNSYPIEIGVAMNSRTRLCLLVRPEADWTHWDLQAEDIHHVSRETLLAHGQSVRQVAIQLNELLSGLTVYSDGWVVDKPWLITLFEAARVRMDFRISPLELILTEKQMEIWHETRERIQDQVKLTRHRACNDAWVIQETFLRSREIANKALIERT